MSQSVDVAEHDIFGELVSDSKGYGEEVNINVMELDDSGQLSAENRVSDANSMKVRYFEPSSQHIITCTELITEFSKDMSNPDNSNTDDGNEIESNNDRPLKLMKLENFHSEYMIRDNYNKSLSPSASRDHHWVFTL